jgi:hypothetical protein
MIGYESQAVNDQLVNVAPGQAYAPTTFGAAYTGPGFWPRNGVFNVPPVVPSPSDQGGMSPTQIGSGGNYGGSIPMPTVSSETGNPFHLTKSPLVWAILMFVVGILMLQFIHYK